MKKRLLALCVGAVFALTGLTCAAASLYGGDRVGSSVSELRSLSVMNGDPDGSIREDERITRAETAAVIARMGAYPDGDGSVFSDLAGSYAEGAAGALCERGIVSGYPDGTFRPSESVTYGEFVTALTRFYWYESAGTAAQLSYPEGYIKEAERIGITAKVRPDPDERLTAAAESVKADPDDGITRGDAAVMVCNLLYTRLRDDGTFLESLISRGGTAAEPEPTAEPESENTFAYKLNSKFDKSENYMFSPLSVKIAMAMAANGAGGETENEICGALGIDDLGEYNKSVKELIKRYSETDSAQLSIANSIWLNRDYVPGADIKFGSEFEKTINDFYSGTSGIVGSSDASRRVNEWTSEKTNGRIPAIINDSDFLAALVNAVYFKGEWTDEFNENATEKDIFKNFDGTESSVDFMRQTESFGVYSDDKLSMIMLPYCGGVSMYISLDDGGDIDYDRYFDKIEYKRVNLKMPKFRVETSKELKDYLKDMGIASAFDQNKADFGKMVEGIPDGYSVYIDKVLHKTYISVDEKGSEAAAATAVLTAPGAAAPDQSEPIEFNVDRPFTFIIREEISGEILFMGRICKL